MSGYNHHLVLPLTHYIGQPKFPRYCIAQAWVLYLQMKLVVLIHFLQLFVRLNIYTRICSVLGLPFLPPDSQLLSDLLHGIPQQHVVTNVLDTWLISLNNWLLGCSALHHQAISLTAVKVVCL